MKNQILSFFLLLGILHTSSAQITNTFPLDDSVGIGTTAPSYLLDIGDKINVMGIKFGNYPGSSIYIGSGDLLNNTTGSNNYVIGGNVLQANTTGSENIGIGGGVLTNNTSGKNNSGIGVSPLTNNISGNDNTALGLETLYMNETGSNNVAIGNNTLRFNKHSSNNTAVGYLSLYNNVKGDNCTAVGFNSLLVNTKGDFNTAVGVNSLDFNTSGNNNTALGYNADVSANNFSNVTAIGNGALVDASNKVRIGNASITSNGGQVEWTAYSDARIKTDVKENVPGLEFINLLKPVTYHFDVDKQNQLQGIYVGEKQDGMYDIEKIQFTGFLAQDVDAAAKKINYDFSGVDKSGELMGLRYSSFVVPIVKSIQELDAEDENLATKNVSQDNEIEQLKSENAELEKRISKLEKLITKQGIVLSDETTAQEISKTQITLQSDAEVASLSQNIPNPFTGKTNINYFVPLTSTSAQIKIANANGQSLFLADVKLGSGVLEIEASQLAAGNYSYTLIVDGRVVDTKLMVIQK